MALENDLFTAILFSIWQRNFRVSLGQTGACTGSPWSSGSHLFVQFDLLGFGRCGHEPEEPTELLPAARVLQLEAQLEGL